MIKVKMVLCFLLAVVLILPLSFAAAPAVQADDREPAAPADSEELQGQPGGTIEYWHCPIMLPWYSGYTDILYPGVYYAKGRWKVYDWEGNKVPVANDAIILIPCQDTACGFYDHQVEVYVIPLFALDSSMPQVGILPPKEITQQILSGKFPQCGMPVPPGENATPSQQTEKQPGYTCPTLFYNGYVGLTKYDPHSMKYKNKPRLSAIYFTGTYGNYANPFWTCTLNAEIKLLNKDWNDRVPKSMKGIVVGWSQSPPPISLDSSPSWAQFEFKFTAKPIPVD